MALEISAAAWPIGIDRAAQIGAQCAAAVGERAAYLVSTVSLENV